VGPASRRSKRATRASKCLKSYVGDEFRMSLNELCTVRPLYSTRPAREPGGGLSAALLFDCPRFD
jgi:hypothetical protein